MLLQPKKLGKVLLNDRANLPDAKGIYLAIDSANRIWYIGKASSIRERHSNHERYSDFVANNVQHIAFFVWEDEEDVNEWEKENIEHYNPPLNDHHRTPEDLEPPVINLGYNKSKYVERYKELKTLLESIETEIEELKPNLVSILEMNGGKIKNEFYRGHLSKRDNYQFSKYLQDLEQEVKDLKKKEKEDGTAVVVSTSIFPVFRFL